MPDSPYFGDFKQVLIVIIAETVFRNSPYNDAKIVITKISDNSITVKAKTAIAFLDFLKNENSNNSFFYRREAANMSPDFTRLQNDIADLATKFQDKRFQFLPKEPGFRIVIQLTKEDCAPENSEDWSNYFKAYSEDARNNLRMLWSNQEADIEKPLIEKPSKIIGISNIPNSGIPEFIGRRNDLNEIHNLLASKSVSKKVAIVGMGGLGKTELGIQYSKKFASSYEGGRCWVRVRDDDPISQIISFARLSDYPINDDFTPSQQLQLIWNIWRPEKTLFIFDDIDYMSDINEILPPDDERFSILITSRNQDLGAPVENYELDYLSEEESLKQLASYISHDRVQNEFSCAKRIVEFMGYLPLGVELIGRYLSTKSKKIEPLERVITKLEEKRDNWRDEGPGVIEDETLVFHGEPLTTAQRGAKAAFDLTWEILTPATRKVASIVSVFPPLSVNWLYISDALTAVFREYSDPDCDEPQQEQAKAQMMQFSLLKLVSENEEIYYYHPLLKDFFRSKMTEDEQLTLPKDDNNGK